jgi:mono/diheme cytochrome c family protein
MTEVPEHLLRRSRERRAALGGGGGGDAGGGGGDTPPAAAASPEPAGEAGGGAVEPAGAAPAPAAAAAKTAPAPDPVSAYLRKPPPKRIPAWMYPALVVLPFWAVIFVGSFGDRTVKKVDPLVLGQQVFTQNCAGCHGAQGQGVGQFPALANGDAKITFPNEADHIKWVQEGSQGKAIGTPYGDPNRAGGQHTVKLAGMPAFAGALSPEQIQAVVTYEREKL